jgi:DNA-binding GntR family transcriptional regulator
MKNTPDVLISLERKSLADQLFIHIKRMILSQELKCGESIPEEKIAKIFGVSRTPIRETLRKLEKYGLVKINPRSQATIVEMGPEEAHYIGEVRNVIEALAARILAKTAGSEDIKSLAEIDQKCVRAVKSGNSGEAFEADGLFHLEIAKRCGNPYIYSILKNLEAKIQLIRVMNCSLKIMTLDIPIHAQIIDAIERHDSKTAFSLMQKHIGDFIHHASPPGKSKRPRALRKLELNA